MIVTGLQQAPSKAPTAPGCGAVGGHLLRDVCSCPEVLTS